MASADISRAVRARVPAKINLQLAVGPRRPDGFHQLNTVFQAVSLHDEVVVRPARSLRVSITGEGADELPTGAGNLAWRAAELLAAQIGVEPDVHIELHRTIPVAGGMAGGSADAAATLLACAALWEAETTKAELAGLAARLGSDVAFPLTGGTALGTGRGEQLTPVLATGEFHWVLALAPFGISTAAAYAELDRLRATSSPPAAGPADGLLDALRAGDPARLAPQLANDLQAAALSLQPRLADVLAAGVGGGALAGIVSGSGPTCAFLCADGLAARGVVDALAAARVCRATLTVTGPVHGARLAV